MKKSNPNPKRPQAAGWAVSTSASLAEAAVPYRPSAGSAGHAAEPPYSPFAPPAAAAASALRALPLPPPPWGHVPKRKRSAITGPRGTLPERWPAEPEFGLWDAGVAPSGSGAAMLPFHAPTRLPTTLGPILGSSAPSGSTTMTAAFGGGCSSDMLGEDLLVQVADRSGFHELPCFFST